MVYANRDKISVGSVTYEDQSGEGAAVSVASGAVAGAIVAGPVGALVGAELGGTFGAVAAPDQKVTTYVTGNPVEPVYPDGEVVVGAGIPETVTLQVPESKYSYA